MLGLKLKGNTKLLVSRWGTLCGVFAMLVFVSGCPMNPCTGVDVDDGDACTVDECTVVEGEAVVTHTPVECDPGLVCDPDTGECVECATDADCDDGDACTTDTCGEDNTCSYADVDCDDGDACTDDSCDSATGCVNAPIDCDDGDACTDDTCEAGECVHTATDCDDNDLCTTDSCDSAIGCVNEPVVCDNGLFCDGLETCDPATGECVAGTNPCAADENCDEVNDVCTEAKTCTVDADCVDELFCNGDETCVGGFCAPGTNPCVAPAVCDEETDTCSIPGEGFNFTLEDDTLNGTTGDDIFTAGVGTLNPGDIAVGNGGDDTLNATIVGSTSDQATLVDIDTLNFTTLNDATFDAVNCAAISAYGVSGSSVGSLTLTNVEAGVDLFMGAGFADLLDVDFSGAGDDFTLTLNGPADGASFDCQDPALDVDVVVAADSFLGCGVPGTDCFGGAASVTVAGSGDLTLTGHQPTDLAADGGAYDMTGFTGMLTVVPEADAASNYDFSTGGADELEGVDQVTIVDTATFAHTLTFDDDDEDVAVDVSEIDENDSAGALTVVQGADDDDVLTVVLGGVGDGMGALTAATTEFVYIVSGGTTANAVANVTTETGTSGIAESVTVTGDQDCDLGTVTSEAIDSTGLDAAAGLTMTAAAGVERIDTGDGDDVITGSAGLDRIDAGGGDDTIVGAAGADDLTGGAGSDTFQFDSAADSGVTRALADDIADFVAGAGGDVMAFDDTGGFALTGTADTLAFEIESDGAFSAATNVFVIDTTAIADLFGGLAATETALDGLINAGAGAGGGIFIVYDQTTDAVYAVYDDDVTADSGTGADITCIVEMGLDGATIGDSGIGDLLEENFAVLP